jgi:hypothetical protein
MFGGNSLRRLPSVAAGTQQQAKVRKQRARERKERDRAKQQL